MSDDIVWIDAGGGYALALDGSKLVCRNPKGSRLASVPNNVKDGEVAEQLRGLVDWLAAHAVDCSGSVETWMLRSLPVPRGVLEAVWPDAAWRTVLENAVVVAVDREGAWSPDVAGFLRGADPARGLGLVNLDGETVWIDAPLVAIPHPILLSELADFRELAAELGISQGVAQLFRETWPKPADLPASTTSLDLYAGARFEQLNHALGRARTVGYRVRGGWATCPVWENGHMVEARYWIGSDSPESEAYTGELSWVDAKGRSLKIAEIGPVAFSEGNRMASLIHAGRAIPKDDEGAAVEPEPAPVAAAPGAAAPTATPAPLRPADALAAGGLSLPDATVPKDLPVDKVGARAYTHPALAGRVVARLTAEVLAPGEDRVMDFLGFGAPEERPGVALQRRRALGFPGWALVNDPDHASFALEVVKEFKKHARRAASKPGFAKEGFDAIGERLGRSVPHFLPPFYEEAGRAFLDVGSPTFAAQAFNKAREAERVHALAVDEDQRRQAFVDFALAGALTVKAISAYAKDLEKSYSADVAYRHFRELCVRRTLGGLPPWASMPKELRALAKTAKLDAETEDATLLGELLEAPSLSRAPAEFWTAYRKQIVKLARAKPETRAVLLNLMPGAELDAEFHGSWIELLDECGAFDALAAPAESDEKRGETAGWLSREIAHVAGRGWRRRQAPDQLFGLLTRMRDRLVADGAPVALDVPEWNRSTIDVDMLDLALELGVPVADPGPKAQLALDAWVQASRTPVRHRDPVHIAAAPKYAGLLSRAVDSVIQQDDFKVAARNLKGLAAARAAWFDARLEALSTGLLHAFQVNLMSLVGALSPDVLTEFPDLGPRVAEVDVAGALARTARAGLLDELGWPALDELVDELRADGAKQIHYSGVFPYVVVTDERRAVVLGAGGRLLDHELRIPKKGAPLRMRYVDGQLLVIYRDQGSYQPHAYWSGSPDEQFDVQWYSYDLSIEAHRAVELAGGGVTEGGRAMHPGDTKFDTNANGVVSDGETCWRYDWADQKHGLREMDPSTGERGRWSMPAFFEEFAAPGMSVNVQGSHLGPLPAGLEETPLGARDRMAGWRVRTRAEEAGGLDEDDEDEVVEVGTGPVVECEGIDGRSWKGRLADNTPPAAIVRFPGDRTKLLSTGYRSTMTLWEEDGRSMIAVENAGAQSSDYAKGSPVVLPLHCWHFLRPRDEAGSRALVGLSTEVAGQLLAAAREDRAAGGEAKTALPATRAKVAELVPEISHPRLGAGLAGLAAVAAAADATLAKALGAQKSGGAGATVAMPVEVDEESFAMALELFTGPIGGYHYGTSHGTPARQAFETGRFFAEGGGDVAQAPVATTTRWWDASAGKIGAMAFLAVSDTLSEAQRNATLQFLELWATLPFGPESERLRTWNGYYEEKTPEVDDDDDDDNVARTQWLAAVGGNRYLVRTDNTWVNGRYRTVLWALEHAPTGEFKPLPGTIVEGSEKFTAEWGADGRAAEFVAAARELGLAPWDPAIAAELSRRTGLTPAAATLLWFACPGFQDYSDNFLPKELRTRLGFKVAEAAAARKELQSIFGGYRGRAPWLPQVFDAAMQGDPRAIWSPLGSGPDDEESPVARFAAAWIARAGRRVPVPAELTVAATKDLARVRLAAADALAAAAEPSRSGLFANDEEWVVSAKNGLGLRSALATAATESEDDDDYEDDDDTGTRKYFDKTALSVAAHYVPYLFVALPAGDPLRANVAEMLDLARERLASPALLLSLAWFTFNDADEAKFAAKLEDFASVFGGEPYAPPGVPADNLPNARDTGELVVVRNPQNKNWGRVEIYFRPSRARDFAALAKLQAQGSSEYYSAGEEVKHCDVVLSDGFTALGERIRSTPVPDGEWEANPLHSAPELVAEVSGALGVSEDAAVLYLQTLALAEPTTKNVQTWNGWTPARYKKTATELSKAGLLLEAKRERAGRAHFLPGGWIPFKAPDLPMESWKLSLYGIGDKKSNYDKPLDRILPLRPLHELFAEAWARVKSGDKPEYEEV